ncbi:MULTISPECIES: DMT family transporter [unclassified Pseudomonas]|uniref:DMT family transporter n=1 Tax=unclassified Pseudomonas TaxID=196821 RepID=UPI002B22F457|nr:MULTISPECIES: DMT family transporter [unclassified Pseudomonas]MEA9977285.1 DMT family transporter [Pseudomonas sp. RTS4]MEB0199963.1 DMT family transporter [Pseudomonas sp. 5S4]MEB0247076.1 DMT family transporter [Pseudomonas sp. 10S5]
MDVFMGLMAAVLWGATDFLVGVNARAVGVRRAVFLGQLLGLIIMSLILILFYGQLLKLLHAALSTLLLGIAASLFTVIGALALSMAFSVGKTAVVAPLVTTYGVFTTILAWCGGDSISQAQFAGILICIVGVILASRTGGAATTDTKTQNKLAIGYALSSAVLYGASFWLQGKYTLPTIGPMNMLWLGYVVGVVCLAPMVIKSISDISIPPVKTIGTICGASLFNLGAFSAFSWGVLSGSLSVVTVISTLSGGIAAILGYVFYRERLTCVQVSGVLLVLIGAVMLHLYS